MALLMDMVEGEGGELQYIPQRVEVLPGLWLGSMPEKIGADLKSVLSLAGATGQRASRDQQIVVTFFEDGALPDVDYLNALADLGLAMWKKGPLLVHCQAGLNRSAMIVVLMLVRSGKMTAGDAVAMLRAKRSTSVLFNVNFLSHVLSLDREARSAA